MLVQLILPLGACVNALKSKKYIFSTHTHIYVYKKYYIHNIFTTHTHTYMRSATFTIFSQHFYNKS